MFWNDERKTVRVWTKRNIPLEGIPFTGKGNRTVMICITGIHGNPMSNPFYFVMGDRLAKNGVDFIMAHTCDAFDRMFVEDRVTGETRIIGSCNECFADSDDDVRSYIDYAESQGYEHIILAGHSLGVNKVIHYLSHNHDERVEHFILLSPADMEHLRRQASPSDVSTIEKMVSEGKGDQKLPFYLFGWIPCIASTGHQWMFDESLNNVHPEKDRDFSQLHSIIQDGAMLIGTYDGFTGGEPVKFLQNLNDHTSHPERNILYFIEGTGHTYNGKHEELTSDVMDMMERWGYIEKRKKARDIFGS